MLPARQALTAEQTPTRRCVAVGARSVEREPCSAAGAECAS